MKKYKRRTPLFSPLIMFAATLFAGIATVTFFIFAGTDNEGFIIFGGITVALFYCSLANVMAVGGRYRYTDKCIELFYLLLYKKLDYSRFSAVVISNAAFNNGYGGMLSAMLMQYRVKGNNGGTKVTFPFITLHKPQYHIDKIKKGMNSRDLYFLNDDEIYCLGICWVDSLKELLKHTNCSVYVLEDVYLRFKGMFDAAFSAYKENLNRFYIITDRSIAYQEYMEEKTV